MTEDQVIADAMRQADELFEDKIRTAMTTLLTFGGSDAEVDLEVIDATLDGCRREWAQERAKIPAIVRQAVAARASAGTGRPPGC